MKQQKATTNQPKARADWPEHPDMPHLKTIGGETDRMAIDSHNSNTKGWYFDLRTKLNSQLEELSGELRDLQARVSVLEKNAGP